MHQEVFKANFFRAIIVPIIIFILLTVAFFAIYSIDGSIPVWTLIFYIIPVVFFIGGQTEKIIVEDDILRYEHGFFFKKQEEALLKDVSAVKVRVVQEVVEDSDGKSSVQRRKYAYVLDKSGNTFYRFKADFIRESNRHRFISAVTSVNPNIDVS